MDVYQLLPVAGYGDATTSEALALRTVFARHGTSRIFSVHPPDPRLSGVDRLEDFQRLVGSPARDAVLLLHFAISDPPLLEFVLQRSERLVLRYHNVTPPELFADHDPTFATQLEAARAEARALRDRVDLAIAASEFSAEDLRRLGYTRTAVAPLILDHGRLRRLRPRAPAFLPEPGPGPVVAFVGRVAPNKGHPALLNAFHVLKTYLEPDARLILAGKSDHLGYQLTLERMIASLRLPDVVFADHVSDQELAAVYRRADVFLSLSEHEGFGVPLLEAMAFDLPVVARAAAAIPETLGGAGIPLPDASPALAAEAVRALYRDAELRRRMVTAGRRRLAELRPEPIGRRIYGLIAGTAS